MVDRYLVDNFVPIKLRKLIPYLTPRRVYMVARRGNFAPSCLANATIGENTVLVDDAHI